MAPNWPIALLTPIRGREPASPTTSLINTWRAGPSTAEVTPSAMQLPYTAHTVRFPLASHAASPRASSAITDWHTIMTLRLGNMSTSRPLSGPMTSMGRNCSATAIPTAAGLPVSCSTSQSWASLCIQTPMLPAKDMPMYRR